MVSRTSRVVKNCPGLIDEAGRPDTSGEGTEEAIDFVGSPPLGDGLELVNDVFAEGIRAIPMSDGYCSSFTEA